MTQTDLFSQGGPAQLLPTDGSAVLHTGVWPTAWADTAMRQLLDGAPWEQHTVSVYGKQHLQPRLCAWFGDPNRTYTYSGLTLTPHPWTPLLAEIRDRCTDLADGVTFTSLLANLYRDGQDTVSWHADDEPALGPNPTIASVSLGTTRRFDLRHRRTGETVKVPLPAGSVLVMSGDCQANWNHQVARTAKVTTPRINLTFRHLP